MEIQLTDFENAAFTVFVVLLTRIILAFDLHLYIPISKVRENGQESTWHLSACRCPTYHTHKPNNQTTKPAKTKTITHVGISLTTTDIPYISQLTNIPQTHTQLDENMRRAHARDAVHTQKFFFRKHMADLDGGGGSSEGAGGHCRCTTVQVRLWVGVIDGLVRGHDCIALPVLRCDDDDGGGPTARRPTQSIATTPQQQNQQLTNNYRSTRR